MGLRGIRRKILTQNINLALKPRFCIRRAKMERKCARMAAWASVPRLPHHIRPAGSIRSAAWASAPRPCPPKVHRRRDQVSTERSSSDTGGARTALPSHGRLRRSAFGLQRFVLPCCRPKVHEVSGMFRLFSVHGAAGGFQAVAEARGERVLDRPNFGKHVLSR